MDNPGTTIDSIIHLFQKYVVERKPQPPHEWMRAAMSINVLKGVEDDKLAQLEFECAQIERSYLDEGKTAAESRARMKANPKFLEARTQQNRCKMIEEFIRLAKKNATLITDQIKNYI